MDDDIARGCLANGEPLDALYGVGWWTPQPENEPDWDGGECPVCHKTAWYWGGRFEHCEECGADKKDLKEDTNENHD